MSRRRRFLTAREQHEMLSPWQAMLPKMASSDHDDDDDEWDDEDDDWDDEDEDDDAPEGVWTPPPYHKNGDYGPTGGMYGTHRERYLEDLFHGHLVDLDDHELADAYEYQRTKPEFKGSDLEDTMWTEISNRVDNELDPVVNENKLEDMLHGTKTPDSPIMDYFNKVHGCDEHLFTPPDRHEPHGNFGDHKDSWDPDAGQDPFDPRIIGASRRYSGGMEEPKVNSGPHRLSIERHLVDEDYRDKWMGSDESYEGDPEMVHEMHSSGAQALKRMQEVAGDWGCTVSEYPGEDRLDSGEPGTRYFQFDGPEEDEVQGYAELRPRPVPTEDYRPDVSAYPQMNRPLLSNRLAAMNELDWEQRGEDLLDHPDEADSVNRAYADDHRYYVLAPWRHDSVHLNGFLDTLDSEQPHMWALIHRFDPDNGYWDHAVTYHPTKEHAMGAAEHHHVTGEAPGRWPGTIPHSEYDPDHVEAWPDIAENVDREREEYDDDEDDYDDDDRPKLSMPDISIKDRQNGLNWQKYLDGKELFYHGRSTGTSDHQYEVTHEHGDAPNKAHLRGKFKVLWSKPGYGSSTGQNAAPDGSFQEEHGGINYHDTLEGALDWAEQHNQEHSWDPDKDVFDPRVFGASKDDDE